MCDWKVIKIKQFLTNSVNTQKKSVNNVYNKYRHGGDTKTNCYKLDYKIIEPLNWFKTC